MGISLTSVCSQSSCCSFRLSCWHKGIGRQVQECVICFFIYPNYSMPCKGKGMKTNQTCIQNTGLKPKQKSEEYLEYIHRGETRNTHAHNDTTRDETRNHTSSKKVKTSTGTHTTNGHWNTNRQPNGEPKGTFIQLQSGKWGPGVHNESFGGICSKIDKCLKKVRNTTSSTTPAPVDDTSWWCFHDHIQC